MRKKWLALGCLLIIVLLGIWAYNVWFGTTKIAFVNFQTITMGGIAKANDNSFIKLQEVPVEELDRLSGFDMVFVNGMGLRVVEEQRQQIQKAADKGVLVYTTMATNPANNICTIDSVDQVALRGYLGSGGRRNYKNMLNYIRKNMDKKLISVEEPGAPIERSSDVLYHVDMDKPGDELDFISVEEYEKYLKSKQLYKEGAKKIVVTGQMADATGLIDTLERVGYNVYPVLSLRRLLDFVREISPDAIINMAHGRLGDEVVKYLEERNILLFAPLTVNSLVEEWEQDPMGMSGGFMSQSIVTPEIDGAIRTSALFAQYEDKEGLRHSFAVPSRLKTYVENIQKTLALKEKPNSEKRVVIYYYKGPGQSAMSAAGMEVVPSLYNLLKKMKEETLEELFLTMRTVLTVPVLAVLIFYTPMRWILELWLPQYHDSLHYLAVLFPICVYETRSVALIDTYLKAYRKEKLILFNSLVTVGISALLSWITVFLMGSLDAAVISIVLLMMFKNIFSEKMLLRSSLPVKVWKDNILEVALTGIFILVNWKIGGITAMLLYTAAYIIYVLLKSKDIKREMKNLKKIARG